MVDKPYEVVKSAKQNACRTCGGFGTVPDRERHQAETRQAPCPDCQPVPTGIRGYREAHYPGEPLSHREIRERLDTPTWPDSQE